MDESSALTYERMACETSCEELAEILFSAMDLGSESMILLEDPTERIVSHSLACVDCMAALAE